MAEYIDREVAISAFYHIDPENNGSDGSTAVFRSDDYSSADVESILSDIPAADVAPTPKWISVKDRLPEDEGQVLAVYHFKSSTSMQFIGTLSYFLLDPQPHWQHEGVGTIVTHWMPLPEPPKEE